MHAAVTAGNLDDLHVKEQSRAVRAVYTSGRVGNDGRHHARHQAIQPLEHGHLETALAGAGRDFETDESAANHHHRE